MSQIDEDMAAVKAVFPTAQSLRTPLGMDCEEVGVRMLLGSASGSVYEPNLAAAAWAQARAFVDAKIPAPPVTPREGMSDQQLAELIFDELYSVQRMCSYLGHPEIPEDYHSVGLDGECDLLKLAKRINTKLQEQPK